MSRILIIEDDNNILQLERDYLEANGYQTTVETNGLSGLKTALSENFDLILLDVMLPDCNGFEICKKIRMQKNTPVIFVTAKKDELDKISGLSFGADDYIVKPFSPGELVARVTAHITRYRILTEEGRKKTGVVICGDLKMDKDAGSATLKDREILLTKKEFEVLYILASQPTTVFSKNELFETVWGYDSLGDTSTLTVHINRLREKLKDADADCDYIKTVWGRGYKFK